MKFILSFSLFLMFLLMGCKTTQKASDPIYTIEERFLDTLSIVADKPDNLKEPEDFKLAPYAPSYTLTNNLLHTKLDLRFDWPKQHVIGKATLTLTPYFYPTKTLVLDAKGFEINKVSYAGQLIDLKYQYDGQQLVIDLGREMPSDQTYDIYIDYIAKPAEVPAGGGSAAITSDQGLFFINPNGDDPTKPQQIWTQGETEWNSRWFPTIDKPNERCTQEMYLTVNKKFKTLSNGTLVNSKNNADGTRTDYWKMDLPHAPYLFMLTVGDFAVVNDKWSGIPVDYYVEPEYESAARGIFSNTTEMLTFFSDLVGVKYPWPKYSQIIVRDYVSGAMENTTGVIFGEFVQKTNRELIDNHNELIVAHELFHHWFGDYVTCESWSNLTMNEGFANYGEYLWLEHKYGTDEADRHRMNELNGYLNSVNRGGAHPLIHFGVENSEDMFDAHSYNKGGLVLHMLRNYLGDKAFFAGLKKYLVDNAYTAVEAHDLRLAMEAVSGQDLNWFFNQWYFESGHPQLDIKYNYNESAGETEVTIEQKQDTDLYPAIFTLPIGIDIYIGKQKAVREHVMMTKRKQTFSFKVTEKPVLVNVDADGVILYEKVDNKTESAYIFQFYNGKKLQDRLEAIEALKESDRPKAKQLMVDALDDPFWGIRRLALRYINPNSDAAVLDKVAELAAKDVRSQVRSSAIGLLGKTKNTKYLPTVKAAVEKDQVYSVISSGLTALAELDEKTATAYAKKLESDENSSIINAIGSVYGMVPDKSHLAYFENNFDKLETFSAFSFFENYSKLLSAMDLSVVDDKVKMLKGFATNQDKSQWKRFSATKAIFDVKSGYDERLSEMDATDSERAPLESRVEAMGEMIKVISDKETNQQLKMIYQNFK